MVIEKVLMAEEAGLTMPQLSHENHSLKFNNHSNSKAKSPEQKYSPDGLFLCETKASLAKMNRIKR